MKTTISKFFHHSRHLPAFGKTRTVLARRRESLGSGLAALLVGLCVMPAASLSALDLELRRLGSTSRSVPRSARLSPKKSYED